jgi:hypothetical protein
MLEIFQRGNWLGYFERLRRYDYKVPMDFSLNFQNILEQEYVSIVRSLIIKFNEASIIKVFIFPMGLP